MWTSKEHRLLVEHFSEEEMGIILREGLTDSVVQLMRKSREGKKRDQDAKRTRKREKRWRESLIDCGRCPKCEIGGYRGETPHLVVCTHCGEEKDLSDAP